MAIGAEAFWRQAQMASIVSLGFFMNGAIDGWIGPAYQKLKSGKDYGTITAEQGQWLALYPEFGHFLIPIPFGILTDIVGRRPVFIFNGILSLLGWITIAFAANVNWLFAGRVILIFTIAIQFTIAHIYLSEICGKHLRGRLSNMAFALYIVGILFQFILGGYCSIRVSSIITLLVCLTYTLSAIFIVESPYYSLARGREDEAKRNFSWFHATGDERLSDEFVAMTKSVRTHQNFRQAFSNLLSRNNCKSFVLVVVLSFLSDMTRRNVALAYMQFISDAGGLFEILILLSVPIAAAILSDVVGRRMMVIVTGCISIFSHLLAGGFDFFRVETDVRAPVFDWLLVITITTYSCSSFIGNSNVLTLRGELLAENSRGLASGFASMVLMATTIIVPTMLQAIVHHLRVYYVFWVLSGISLVFTVFTMIYVPETKNKTLQEIQEGLSKTAPSTGECELTNVDRGGASS